MNNGFTYVPGWWSDSGGAILVAGAPVNNFALANMGQLKWFAMQAKRHFDATLTGGASSDINTMVAAFTPVAGVTYTPVQLTQFHQYNYAPINLGQLKAVAMPFYAQLRSTAVNYSTNQNLKANGYPAWWTSDYPWDMSTPKSANYAPVTIGQLKLAFSFEIVDSNGNGVWDYLEGIYPAYNPYRDTDGDGVPDVLDAYPNDPTRAIQLVNNPSDHTPPTITITAPIGTVLTP